MSEIELLGKMVSIDSIFPNEKKLALFTANYLRRNGFKVQLQKFGENRYNVLAERGKKGKAFLFYGHLDTVPIYGKWITNPFRLTKRGNRLYGRGSSDMKGGIAAMLEAVKRVDKNKRIKILLGSDEENISEGAWAAYKKKKSWFNDVGFILSGEQGYAGKIDSGGVGLITLGRRGRSVIRVDVEGVSVHGSLPSRGVNALTEVAKIGLAMEKLSLRKHECLPQETYFVRRIMGESTSLSIPDKALIDIDIHLVQPSTSKEVRSRIEKLIKGLKSSGVLDRRTKFKVSIKKRATPYLEPYYFSVKNPKIAKAMSIITKNFGRPKISYGTSVADENVFAMFGVPVITIGPKGRNVHAKNEFVYEDSMHELVRLYTLLIEGI